MGFWNEFMDFDRNQVEFIGVEAGGPKKVNIMQHHLQIIQKLVFYMVQHSM